MKPPLMKPPLGIIPRHLWRQGIENERINDIMRALAAYRNAEVSIPEEWLMELTDLMLSRASAPQTAQPAAQDAPSVDISPWPTSWAYQQACTALEDTKKLAKRWLTALNQIRATSGQKSAEIAKRAVCNCWKEKSQVCDFCQGCWGEYLTDAPVKS
jgi:hypothetical protein